ncbi:MAG: hypothetical protein K8F30_03510, partial [Taibaiella sp.]|nr:hypothetical protein [Taibaiella sp.]
MAAKTSPLKDQSDKRGYAFRVKPKIVISILIIFVPLALASLLGTIFALTRASEIGTAGIIVSLVIAVLLIIAIIWVYFFRRYTLLFITQEGFEYTGI